MDENQQTPTAPVVSPVPPASASRRSQRGGFGWKSVVLSTVAAFAVGGGVVGWLAWERGFDLGALVGMARSVDIAPMIAAAPPETDGVLESTDPETRAAATHAVAAVAQVEQAQGGFDQRIAAMEQRLARLDLQAQAASGNAARAEGLLIAFATRRSMERGAPLGYLADQLRLRFGDARPNAVRTIIEASRDPVTLDQLMARLEGLSPELVSAPRNEAFWAQAQRELNNLFIIRRESSPSPAPRRRLERAKTFLESGRVEAAVAEVRNMPGADADHVRDWVDDAERYARTQTALDLIETTAVLDPRDLRDSSGNKVEQLSPVVID